MADDAPLVKTGDIEEAEFTVNKVIYEDGEVVEREVDVDFDEESLADFEETIDAQIDAAVEAIDKGVTENVEEALEHAETAFEEMDVPDPDPDETVGVSPETESDGLSDDPPESPPDTGGLVEDARAIVDNEDITTTDYALFRSHMLDDGYDDDDVTEGWDALRDEDYIPKGTVGGDGDGDGGDGDGGDGDGGEDDESESPADTVDFDPEDVDESEKEPLTVAGVDIEPGTDILVGFESDDASALAVELLTDGFADQEIAWADLEGEFGKQVAEQLDDPPDAPFHLVWDGFGFGYGDLEELLERYA